jgi:A/G-specific adenine glycosylase
MDWFAKQLLGWFEENGRFDLPWQADITPYRVWVSEIMLQQTQVTTVIDYFNRFMARFPNIVSLADANIDEVLHLWTGLGYYARGRNLHKSAQLIVAKHQGEMPTDQAGLEALPGIGRSTAGAIRALAMGQPGVILDGNVKRVLARFHGIKGYPGETKINARMWLEAAKHTPKTATSAYTQAIMDLGATLCTRRRPGCERCPMLRDCKAYNEDTITLLPTPKKKTIKPFRNSKFFICSLPNRATLLEQRPLNGLWGGLWNPPERSSDTLLENYLKELNLTLSDVDYRSGPKFRHTFTHFHLEVESIYISVKTEPKLVVQESDTRWVLPEHLKNNNETIGLSAVAVKLLGGLEKLKAELELTEPNRE